MKVTVKQFADANDLTPVQARSVIRLLKQKGKAKICAKKDTGGRGRPEDVFDIRKNVRLSFEDNEERASA